MNKIMDKLFEQYKFTKTWEEDNKMFYVNTDKNIVSYFILNFIDCTNILDNEELIRAELEKLEEEYIETESDKKGIKYSIINSFKTMQEISQIDKNTSAIYLVKFSEENMLTNYRNLIYSIEESPNYFKRYILPYTEKQVEGLKRSYLVIMIKILLRYFRNWQMLRKITIHLCMVQIIIAFMNL